MCYPNVSRCQNKLSNQLPTNRPPPRKEVISSGKGEGSLKRVDSPRPVGMSHPVLFRLMTLVHLLCFSRAAKPTCWMGHLVSVASTFQVSRGPDPVMEK